MKHLNGKWLLGFAALLCLVLSLWPGVPGKQPLGDENFEESTLETMQPLIKEYHRGDPVFSVTIEEYIRCFNSLFERENRSEYFPGSRDWDISSTGKGIHTDYPVMAFSFSEDPEVFSLPRVTVHTPLEERFIQEIIIHFDEHSYTEAGFERYRLLCADTLKVFFPELSREAAWELCDEILSMGNEHIFSSQEWYGSGALPYALFYKGNVGAYSYDAMGDWRHFCVIPVTEDRLRAFEEKGVALYEMEEAGGAAASPAGAYGLPSGGTDGGENGAAG